VPSCQRREEACARRILQARRRAYRRPVTDEDVQPLMKIMGGAPHALRFPRARLKPCRLSGVPLPHRARPDRRRAGAVYRLSDSSSPRALLLLWKGIPDDELLDVA
jgi:hypothetical protein